jgi:galactose oxidase
MDQRINFLAFRPAAGGLTITPPENPDICPPGHYMLFVLNKAKVPSIAKILRIAAPAGAHRRAMFQPAAARAQAVPAEVQMSTAQLDAKIRSEASGTQAAVGLTSRCPYGLGACWGGAYEALQKLDGVQAVRPIANAEDSTADVYLHGDTLPNVDRWAEQIARVANGSYDFRGVEVSVKATVAAQNGGLRLTGPSIDKPVALAPLEQGEKIQFDRPSGTAKLATADELAAYERLLARYRSAGATDFAGARDRPAQDARHWLGPSCTQF